MLQPLRKHADPAVQIEFQNLYRLLASFSTDAMRLDTLLELIQLALTEIVERPDGDPSGFISEIEEINEDYQLLFSSVILVLLQIVDDPGDGLLFVVE